MSASTAMPATSPGHAQHLAARFQVLAGGRTGAAAAPVSAGLAEPQVAGRRFSLEALAGRFVELSGVGAAPLLSVALRLVLDAQRRGENAVWIATSPSTFYAGDAAQHGLDLQALPLVVAPGGVESPVLQAGRAASHLLRSGAFGLVVLDLTGGERPGAGAPSASSEPLPMPLLSRLTGLAQKHGTLLLALTHKAQDAPSLGSLVSLHAHVARPAPGPGGYRVELSIIKDKRHGPGWSHHEHFRGPDGLG